ncbi:MAG: serine kinase [Rhodobacteraceae bacterium]|nr:serine kinase [Paracoccaceae bacterium]
MTGAETIVHASTVALRSPGDDWRGVLIIGRSGAGKSTLALQLMALGAALVADDRTRLWCDANGRLRADSPAAIAGLIEARGVGVLRAGAAGEVAVHLAVDLDRTEPERLPPVRHIELLGQPVICLQKAETAAFPAAIVQYVLHGREGDA